MWKLALRNVSRQKLRTAMTVGAIAAGVVSLVLAGGFVADIFVQLREFTIHSQLGHMQVYKEGYYQYGTQAPAKYVIDDPEPVKAALLKNPQVNDVMARLNFSGLMSNGRSDLAIIGEGVEPNKEQKLGTYLSIIAGRHLTDDDQFGIVLGEGVAQSQKLSPGERVTLLMNNKDGSLNSLDFEVVGVFRSFSKEFDSRAVRIPLAAAQELLTSPGVNSLVVSLQRTADTEAVAAATRLQLSGKGYELKTWEELSDFYRSTVELYDVQFGVLRLIILGMVVLGVANSVNMSIFERYGEFGTMRALGDRNRTVFGLILAENVIVGSTGAAIGIVLGILLAVAISAVGIPMPPPPNSNTPYVAYIRLVPLDLLGAFVIGLMAAVTAASMPSWRVSRSHVADALRRNI
ncbi:MAG: ABC transporter permease [Burkholderiales bacterium]|nr:ABC transporter permease [Burkholderiales bacterium]